MLENATNTQHLDIFTEALERFEDVFAIYDQDYKLVFANSAARAAMPAYFDALSRGQGIWEAHRLQIIQTLPNMPADKVIAHIHVMTEKLYSRAVYEVGISRNRTIQVRHETLNEHHTLALGMDVSQIKSQQAEMEKLAKENFNLANTDQLTNLANRRQFIEVLNKKIVKKQLTDGTFFVGLIDLNGFKRINDLYGHAIGDELLTSIAQRASDFIDEDTFLARLGGDEFALIFDSDITQTGLLSFSEKLGRWLRQKQTLSGNDISVSASLGWSCYPKDGQTTSDLLRKSDYALYKSKEQKTKTSVVFSGFDETVMLRQSEITMQLETAELETELFLEFQPIHDTQTGLATGLEALARWHSPVLGEISPVEFIPLAEKTGNISAISKIVLQKALRAAAQWPQKIDLHFNISAIDLGKIDVIREFINIVSQSDVPAKSVVFEVTETALIDTFENMSEVFDLFKDNGLRLALDDFGTGHSSLSYLARIPVTCLKIDKSFTNRLKPGSDVEAILKTIKYLCEHLEIKCIIEGIESHSQFQQLSSLGLHQMQCFYFSRSLKLENLGAYLMGYVSGNADYHSLDKENHDNNIYNMKEIAAKQR